jgi:subtilisin family serine protease
LEQSGSLVNSFRTHRGDSISSADNRSLVVGNLDDQSNDRKRDSSVCGNIVDIHAAGSGIVSSLYTGSQVSDARNSNFGFSKYTGTSMAAPQVSGVIALLAESNPGITQSEVNDWLNKNGTDNVMYDTQTDDCTDFESLQGASNKLLRWINQRPESGIIFPKINTKARPDSGKSWPRPRIRIRG